MADAVALERGALMRPIFEPWRVALFVMIVPAGWAYVWALSPADA